MLCICLIKQAIVFYWALKYFCLPISRAQSYFIALQNLKRFCFPTNMRQSYCITHKNLQQLNCIQKIRISTNPKCFFFINNLVRVLLFISNKVLQDIQQMPFCDFRLLSMLLFRIIIFNACEEKKQNFSCPFSR